MPAYKDKQRGTWFVKYSVTVDGKRKQVLKRGFETKRDALQYESAMRLASPGSSLTFQDLANNYFDYRNAKENTRKPQESALQTYMPYMQRRVDQISKADMMQFYLSLSGLDLCNNSKNWLLGIIKAVFRFGHDFYELPNPAATLKRFKPDKTEMQTWQPDEFERFLAVVDNDLYKAFFSFLYWTGCRKGEAQALRYTDFKGNTVHIHQQWNDGFSDLKTGSSERTLILPNTLQGVLEPLLARCSEGEPFVFGGVEPISKGALRYWWERSIRLADVKPIRMHDLRHSFATNMINSGANIVAVSKYLGHANINMTLNTYTHLLANSNAEMVALLDDLMQNGIKSVSQPL